MATRTNYPTTTDALLDPTAEPMKIVQKVQYTFIAECEAEVLANSFTIYGRPGLAEPHLCAEFQAIFEVIFPGKITVVRSTVEAVATPLPCDDAA